MINETDVEPSVLRCNGCGIVTDRLVAIQETVRSLSLGRNLHPGDLLCERCLGNLQEERTDEETERGPA